MVREWQHLTMLKRAGVAHEDLPIKQLAEGSCTVLCPCCLHPGINLLEDWNKVPEEQR